VQAESGPLILSIDSTTDVRSVALVAGRRVRAQCATSLRGAKSANLLGDIDTVLHKEGTHLRDIDLFAVATGPGSFTGLRAGLATVKAFAATLGKACVGVPTLHAIARASGTAARVVATLPAGRGEIFAQLLQVTASGAVEELSAPMHISPQALIARAASWSQPLHWCGTGAQAYAESLRDAAGQLDIAWHVESAKDMVKEILDAEEGARVWLLGPPFETLAVEVAGLALLAYENGRTLPAEELRALYVRPSDAELNEQCRV
jgi:tRNA threonylcarbamoyladenosine biosynthesis protein TsaB